MHGHHKECRVPARGCRQALADGEALKKYAGAVGCEVEVRLVPAGGRRSAGAAEGAANGAAATQSPAALTE